MKTVIISLNDKRQPAGLLAAGFFEEDKISKTLESLEPSFSSAVKKAIENARFEGKFGQTFVSSHTDYRESSEIVLIGLGKRANYKPMCFRKAAAQIIQLAKSRKIESVRFVADSFANRNLDLSQIAGTAAEVLLLATYEFDRYKTKKENSKNKKIDTVEILTEKKADSAVLKAAEEARFVAEGVLMCRDFINEPANIMTAQKLASEATKMANRKGLECEILEQADLKRLQMGGILAVNQGSQNPPALIILEHGKQYKKNGTVCLVGKGVTFDTGGISIKPAKDMEKMKYDMSGAAAVISTMGVIADLKLKVHVVGITPAVENNVSENPQRPGDIIRMHNGKTVEVLNTDAEGRLILGDALSYSEKFKPKVIIDLATLTGMCAYTFGDKAIGLLSNDQKLVDKIIKAGQESGERCWQLPLWDEYGDQIKGHHSDLYNIGGAYGGTITAAMFLKEFVPADTSWAHLDIAGTAWADSNRVDCVKGGTGVGVRLLITFLRDFSSSN